MADAKKQVPGGSGEAGDPGPLATPVAANQAPPGGGDGIRPPLPVELKPSGPGAPQPSREFWKAIRTATEGIGFKALDEHLTTVFCPTTAQSADHADRGYTAGKCLPSCLTGVRGYQLLKCAVELFLMERCGFKWTAADDAATTRGQVATYLRLTYPGMTAGTLLEYLNDRPGSAELRELPYFQRVRTQTLTGGRDIGNACEGVLRSRVDIRTAPCLLELIWNYWHEQGALVQAINVVALRFQNRVDPQGRNPLVNLNIAPLHGLSPLLFGYIQDEYNRLTIQRRAYEYDHHYGLTLYGKAVKPLQSVDSRSKFIEAFHHLLHRTARFYRQDDDLTVKADGFPVLQALKEVHLLLTQGMHNQYGDLPWTSRVEMLVQEWLLARPEIAQFLNSRPMVPYQEGWMAQVDTLKKMFGWPEASASHFRDLGVFGEQLLLSIRFHLWLQENGPDPAAEWAREWRPEIQSYIHAYRAVTGVDLLVEPVNTTPPSTLLRDRLTQAPSAV